MSLRHNFSCCAVLQSSALDFHELSATLGKSARHGRDMTDASDRTRKLAVEGILG